MGVKIKAIKSYPNGLVSSLFSCKITHYHEITTKEFNEIKLEIQTQIEGLNRQVNQNQFTDENLNDEIEFCVKLLSNVDTIYHVADVKTKQEIIGSIFPNKLIFENKKYRTNKLEDAISLLCFGNNTLNECKKEKHPVNEMLSLLVAPLGLEPRTYGLENRCSIQLSYGTIR
jgi:site-specific DNA recombinase